MTHLNLKHFYSHFLGAQKNKLHFAAHSHHFWPDISREAHLNYWDDSAKFVDNKWEFIFQQIVPEFQKKIASLLNLKNHSQIAFAPNTHELVFRLISHFLNEEHVTILTTTSEFHSFKRQLKRLMELPNFSAEFVSTESLLRSRQLFIQDIKEGLKKNPTLFFMSQVFFDSGLALSDKELYDICESANPRTTIIIDGYHGFAAIPTDLSKLEGRIFYISGGYKYAQAGEGAGFMVIPQGDWRPVYTGWFAEFSELTSAQNDQTRYSKDGMAFMGATQDPSGLYRFNRVWEFFQTKHLSVEKIHDHVSTLQKIFLDQLPHEFLEAWKLTILKDPSASVHGHFLTFKAPSEEVAQTLEKTLCESMIFIDRRGDRLRFGFGLYHSDNEIYALIAKLKVLTK
jgi:selenocysteine lyase/cysteine desulfurase